MGKGGVRMNEEEMDEHTRETLQRVAIVSNTNVQEVVSEFKKLWQAVGETIVEIVEQMGDIFAELPDLPRTPTEIKKDIKHEKNPMRLKQLNQELNESYKVYRKRGKK
jgi:hypothetical protein